MRLLADENLPLQAVEVLRELGHDVAWVKESAPSIKDDAVLSWATRETRVVVTFDKDFGELAFRSKLPAECGIVLFRLPPIPSLVAAITRSVFHAEADFEGRFVIVEPGRIRERPLPV